QHSTHDRALPTTNTTVQTIRILSTVTRFFTHFTHKPLPHTPVHITHFLRYTLPIATAQHSHTLLTATAQHSHTLPIATAFTYITHCNSTAFTYAAHCHNIRIRYPLPQHSHTLPTLQYILPIATAYSHIAHHRHSIRIHYPSPLHSADIVLSLLHSYYITHRHRIRINVAVTATAFAYITHRHSIRDGSPLAFSHTLPIATAPQKVITHRQLCIRIHYPSPQHNIHIHYPSPQHSIHLHYSSPQFSNRIIH
ncbi:hypothetical protein AVEN_30711-1, partial [Araneus ventricosus]